MSDTIVNIHANKVGPRGRPIAVITTNASVPLDKLTAVIQKYITRNDDLRKKLGLTACGGCASSGWDLDIRHQFDHVLQADLNKM